MIAIHLNKSGFASRWIDYCIANGIPYRIVNCYDNNIIEQLKDSKVLFWHFHHSDPKDIVMARSLLNALLQSGKIIFPDWKSMWHFDDKLGQKYLLESLNIPMVNTYAFFEKSTAYEWAETAAFPKVFKLRGGAGSSNVSLIHTKKEAKSIIDKAFSSGFSNYNAIASIKERFRKWRSGKSSLRSLINGFVRIFYPPRYVKALGKEYGYTYFQDYIPDNDSDIRVVVINNKAFAIKRMVRKGDFRASGSGTILYDKTLFDEPTIQLAFNAASKLGAQVVAFDFVYLHNIPLVIEISYGFSPEGYDECTGYWDAKMNWHNGPFNPYGWMIDGVLKDIKV